MARALAAALPHSPAGPPARAVPRNSCSPCANVHASPRTQDPPCDHRKHSFSLYPPALFSTSGSWEKSHFSPNWTEKCVLSAKLSQERRIKVTFGRILRGISQWALRPGISHCCACTNKASGQLLCRHAHTCRDAPTRVPTSAGACRISQVEAGMLS